MGPLADAAASGSVSLLERVAMRLQANVQLDLALYEHRFARAMRVAVEHNDLAMVQKIHELHPAPLVVHSLQLALQFGSLELVQWTIEHRHDRLCCLPGLDNLCASCWLQALNSLRVHDAARMVQWAVSNQLVVPANILESAAVMSVELLDWADQKRLIHLDQDFATLVNRAIESDNPSLDVIQYLVHRGSTLQKKREREELLLRLIKTSCQPGTESIVRCVLASPLCDSFQPPLIYAAIRPGGAPVLQWPDEYTQVISTRVGIPKYAHDHTATLQWLLTQKSNCCVEQSFTACVSSEQDMLEMLMWKHAHGVGKWSPREMDAAAERGYLRVVQWLHENRTEGYTQDAIHAAARGGHLHIVQWLADHGVEGSLWRAVYVAARGGHLHIVQWIQARQIDGWDEWDSEDAGETLQIAAGNGHLDVVQWLYGNDYKHKPMACTAMVTAALEGQMAVLMWLHANTHFACTACTRQALLTRPRAYLGRDNTFAVLNALRWLDAHQPDSPPRCVLEPRASHGVDRNLAVEAVCCGDLQLLEYLHEHHSEVFQAFQKYDPHDVAKWLVENGHLCTAQWLHTHYRDTVDWQRVSANAEANARDDLDHWKALVVKPRRRRFGE